MGDGESLTECTGFDWDETDAGRLLFLVFTVRQNFNPRHLGARHESQREEGLSIVVKKNVPKFKTEDEERRFWASQDSTEYVDWAKAQRVVPSKLKPSVKTISLRLPESMLEELKLIANKRDVPYQSLVKMFLAERIEEEIRGGLPRPAKA